MNADASQGALPLGVFLALTLPAFGICLLVWLFADGGQRIERARAELPTDDDEPDRCTHPECEQARQVHRERVRRQLAVIRARSFTAARARVEWTNADDEQLHEYTRSHGGT